MNPRHNHGLQLPRCRLRLELSSGNVLRQHHGLERSSHHPTHLNCHHQVGDDCCCTIVEFPQGALLTSWKGTVFLGRFPLSARYSGTDIGYWTLDTGHWTSDIGQCSSHIYIASKGGTDVGVEMANDKRVKLVSFTGSTQVGRRLTLYLCTTQSLVENQPRWTEDEVCLVSSQSLFDRLASLLRWLCKIGI